MLFNSKIAYWCITLVVVLFIGTLGIMSSVPYTKIFISLSLFIVFMLIAFHCFQWSKEQQKYFQDYPDEAKEYERKVKEKNKIIDDHPILFSFLGVPVYIGIAIICAIAAWAFRFLGINL